MTPNPTCVSMSDPAMEALATMVENHFRHLPVVDSKGSVVGLLDIAKCLNDAISKLERSNDQSNSAAEDAVKQVANLQGAGGAQAAALQALLGPLMSQAFGGQQSPTLRSILAGKPATMVSPDTSLRDAGEIMADRRKAALVVDDGELVGIFGFKDMMTRAIAKELPLSETAISSVMTPEPESVSPDMTVLEALQTMHDHKFLTLPVCESDGTVVGIVDVMDCIYNSSKDGWRSLFDSAMEIDDGTASLNSGGSGASAGRSVGGRSSVSARGSVKSAKSTKDERPVSKLRPKKPLISTVDDSILSVTQMLAKKRGDASLVIGSSGGLAGIITDTDITRRVVAKDVDPHYSIAKVMTPNPTCVSMSDPAMEALATMVENHFRHLPVVDSKGSVVGLLDIAKCLNDAISKLERSNDQSNSAAEDAVKQVANLQGAGGAQAAALQALLGPLMSQAFGGQQSPTLRSILAGKPATMVSPDTSLRDAGEIMADRRKAALVVDDGELVGIFGFKDMMTRAIAKELPLSETAISSVMTPEPESVSPDMTVLEALQTMHDHKFLTLPVCESDGTVVGIVDVMDCIYNSSKDGWRSLFDSAMEIEGGDDASQSIDSMTRPEDDIGPLRSEEVKIMVSPETRFASVPRGIPTELLVEDSGDNDSLGVSLLNEPTRDFGGGASQADLTGSVSTEGQILFKVVDPNGKTHRIRSDLKLDKLLNQLLKKIKGVEDSSSIILNFSDDEGDEILITNDDDLIESVNVARSTGNKVVKLTATLQESKQLDQNVVIAGAAGAVLAIVVAVVLATTKGKK